MKENLMWANVVLSKDVQAEKWLGSEINTIINNPEQRLLSLINSWKYALSKTKRERFLDKKTQNYIYEFDLIAKNKNDKNLSFTLEFLPENNKVQILNFEWRQIKLNSNNEKLLWILKEIYPFPAYTLDLTWKVRSIISWNFNFLNK